MCGREPWFGERRRAIAVGEAVGRGDDRNRLGTQIASSFRGGHDDGRGSIVLWTAVVEVERLGDPARRVVRLASERRSEADGPWVALRMLVAGERDLGERILRDAVLVHEPHGLHGADLRG